METEFEKLFGNLNKIAKSDKCTNAIFQTDHGLKPSPCEFAKVAGLLYCKLHGAIKSKQNE